MKSNGHEFEQTLGDSEGHGGLVCCSLWGHKGLDMTEHLNNDEDSCGGPKSSLPQTSRKTPGWASPGMTEMTPFPVLLDRPMWWYYYFRLSLQ